MWCSGGGGVERDREREFLHPALLNSKDEEACVKKKERERKVGKRFPYA